MTAIPHKQTKWLVAQLDEIGRELNFRLDLGDDTEEEIESTGESASASPDEDVVVKMQASAPGADE